MARPSRASGGAVAELPPYQPPTHPLTPAAQRSLQALRETHSLRKLKAHIAAANGAVTEMAGAINDQLIQGEAQMRRRRARREKEGLGMEEDEHEEKLQEMRREVEEMTGEMEASTRKLIDIETRVFGMEEVLKELAHNAIAGGAASSGRPQAPQGRRRRRVNDGSDENLSDEYMEASDEEGEGNYAGALQSFRRGLRKRKTDYENQSQRQK